MLTIIWSVISFTILSFVIVRPPKRIGIKSVTTNTRLLGSPREAENLLNNVTIVLFAADTVNTVFLKF